MDELLGVMRRLRGPDGCPWDQEQTHESLRPYLLEEAAEAVDAIEAGDPRELTGELGDVLLQVAFHSVIAEENGAFTYADVERHIVDKLVRRHPHVFGEIEVEGSAQVVANWQAIKAVEQGGQPRRPSARVPSSLGALARMAATQSLNMPPLSPSQAREEVGAALHAASNDADGVAEVLTRVVAWARSLGVDPELCLRDRTAAALRQLDEQATPSERGPGV